MGTKQYFESLGFDDVCEAATYETHELSPTTRLTYVANNLDSITVLEAGGEVLVNLSDALHAYPPRVIDSFVEALRRRWPRIDYVYCGFGGASYFPNCLHMPGKDDHATSLLREQLFAHNFCRIVAALEPRIAVPFAADFVMLAPEKRWINEARYPREDLAQLYRELYGGAACVPKIWPMYPGDVLQGTRLLQQSPYRAQLREGGLVHLLEEQYGPELAEWRRRRADFIDAESARRLEGEVLENLRARARLFDPAKLEKLEFTIRLTDVEHDACFVVRFRGGAPRLRRAAQPSSASRVVLELSSEILRYSLASEWGGDAIVIGYGVEVHIADTDVVLDGLDTVCVRLLTRHPSARRFMAKHVGRAAKFLYTNPLTRKWALQSLAHRREARSLYDGELWLLRSKCEICQICDMPLLSNEFSAQLQG